MKFTIYLEDILAAACLIAALLIAAYQLGRTALERRIKREMRRLARLGFNPGISAGFDWAKPGTDRTVIIEWLKPGPDDVDLGTLPPPPGSPERRPDTDEGFTRFDWRDGSKW